MLSSALSACARRVAKHLGWRSEDLEAVVESYAGLEPEVMEGVEAHNAWSSVELFF